jgi:hypothetical protein
MISIIFSLLLNAIYSKKYIMEKLLEQYFQFAKFKDLYEQSAVQKWEYEVGFGSTKLHTSISHITISSLVCIVGSEPSPLSSPEYGVSVVLGRTVDVGISVSSAVSTVASDLSVGDQIHSMDAVGSISSSSESSAPLSPELSASGVVGRYI